jgi:hypothetical protein
VEHLLEQPVNPSSLSRVEAIVESLIR